MANVKPDMLHGITVFVGGVVKREQLQAQKTIISKQRKREITVKFLKKLPGIKWPKIKWPKIDIHNWPSTAFSLFSIFGVAVGCIMIHSSYIHYQKGNIIDTGYGITMGLMIIFIYCFNNRFINRLADQRLSLWKDVIIREQGLNTTKMQVEIAMRRAGVDVPKEMEAEIPRLHDLADQALFVAKCPDPECKG